jgi:hypothetical protein
MRKTLLKTDSPGLPTATVSGERLPPVHRPIAKRVGYRDASRFGQHFKRPFEATPVEYRTTEQRG